MKRVLAGLLLIGIVACGEIDSDVAALKKLGTEVMRTTWELGRGEVGFVDLGGTKVSDVGTVYLKRLTKQSDRSLSCWKNDNSP